MSDNSRSTEKLLLILLFFITVTQFSTWGYQSVKYILGTIFDVKILSTPFDTVIGIAAMVASALVFAGAAMWWKGKVSAKDYFIFGSLLFVLKNILDIINQVILFGIKYEGVTKSVSNIEGLAISIGNEFFQLAFWVFVMMYFRYRISQSESGEAVSAPQQESGQISFTR